jgi:hypothetical protein
MGKMKYSSKNLVGNLKGRVHQEGVDERIILKRYRMRQSPGL